MLGSLKARARKSKTAIIVYKLLDNWKLKRKFKAGEFETSYGSTHQHKTIPESLAYINLQFEQYLKHSGLSSADLSGKRILELGPGDNLGVALRFLAAGAAKVVCFDKFFSTRDEQHQSKIYSALRDSLNEEEQRRFDQVVDASSASALDASRVEYVYGSELADWVSTGAGKDATFDLIISRAVIEEVYATSALFDVMDRLLARGGMMLHKIDLGDYGMFTGAEMHPLTFLTISESVYRRMADHSGLPSRRPVSFYVSLMKKLGYDYKIIVTDSIIEERLAEPFEFEQASSKFDQSALDVVEAIRPKLSAEFRSLPAPELAVGGIFLVGRKRN
jgi:hypothetical protein